MKKLGKILLGLVLGIFLVIVIGFFFLQWASKPTPEDKRNMSLDGVKMEVEVVDDTRKPIIKTMKLADYKKQTQEEEERLEDNVKGRVEGDIQTKFHYGRNFDLLYGEEFLEESLVGYNFQISPGSFFQINLSQAEKLVSMVKDSLNHRSWDLVMDLFCGIGSLSLPLSEISQEVIGVELNPRAIDDARQVAKSNGKNNLRYIAGKVENILPRLLEEENLSPQALVLDPPRAGVEPKALEAILESHPQRITYVSCNPSTLARDLKILKERYRIEKITPLDMFPRTAHVETVVLMSRIEK